MPETFQQAFQARKDLDEKRIQVSKQIHDLYLKAQADLHKEKFPRRRTPKKLLKIMDGLGADVFFEVKERADAASDAVALEYVRAHAVRAEVAEVKVAGAFDSVHDSGWGGGQCFGYCDISGDGNGFSGGDGYGDGDGDGDGYGAEYRPWHNDVFGGGKGCGDPEKYG